MSNTHTWRPEDPSHEMILKGHELHWILQLAEDMYLQKKMAGELDRYNLDEFLGMLLGRFHTANFNAGGSGTTWKLTRVEDNES